MCFRLSPDPLRGLRPWTPLGDFRTRDPLTCAVQKVPLKSPGSHDPDLSRSRDVILGFIDNWVTTLTFLGHVTSSVKWTLDSPYSISYSCPIVTKPLSTALFEILGPKDNCVTTLIFLGHVTSSVTWPLDSPNPIFYSCPSVTKPLSPALFEIFDPKVPCAHTDTHTHRHTPQSDFIFCPMQGIALDNNACRPK